MDLSGDEPFYGWQENEPHELAGQHLLADVREEQEQVGGPV